MDTRYGKIEELSVPRDRQGEFQTQVFAPYQRRDGWLEEAIIKMYQSGMSTREVGKFIERSLGSLYSAATISNITDVAMSRLGNNVNDIRVIQCCILMGCISNSAVTLLPMK